MSEQAFKSLVISAEASIENFNDYADDRGVVWAAERIKKLECMVAMQAEALKLALKQNQCDMILTGDECRVIEAAISATAETVAAWTQEVEQRGAVKFVESLRCIPSIGLSERQFG